MDQKISLTSNNLLHVSLLSEKGVPMAGFQYLDQIEKLNNALNGISQYVVI